MAIPPVEALLDTSETFLQDLELAARNRAANISKAVKSELEMWIEQMTAAALARWMIENRQELLQKCSVNIAPKKVDFLDVRGGKKSA